MRPIIDPPGDSYSYEDWANERGAREAPATALDWYDEQQAGEGITRDSFHMFVLALQQDAYAEGRKDEQEQCLLLCEVQAEALDNGMHTERLPEWRAIINLANAIRWTGKP